MADEKEANAEPAMFLLTLQDECPSITKLLNQKQLQFLETSPHLAYGKDSENVNVEFCKDLSSFYTTRLNIFEIKRELKKSLLLPEKSTKEVQIDKSDLKIASLIKVSALEYHPYSVTLSNTFLLSCEICTRYLGKILFIQVLPLDYMT